MNKMKRLTAALLAAMVILPMSACGEKITNNSTADNSAGDNQTPGDNNNAADPNGGNGGEANGNGGGNAEANPDVQMFDKNVVVGDDGSQNQALSFSQNFNDNSAVNVPFRGEDGNYYVAKTDINGNAAVDGNGETQTDVYKDTGKMEYQLNYTPSIKSYQALWLDISQKADFVFDGNLLEYEVKVADDAPDGIYPVEVYYTDFSNYSANTDDNAAKLRDVDMIKGYICVNKDAPEAEKPGDKMTISAESISVKPGDTARFNVRLDNNPGIVAFVVRLHYDSNIITVNKAAAGSELGKRARLTTNMLDDEE